MKKGKSKKKSIITPIIICTIGIAAILYLPLSDMQNTKLHLQDVQRYEYLLQEEKKVDRSETLKQAQEYNNRLENTEKAFYNPNWVEGYDEALKLAETDVMAYLEIPKIAAKLPIYHGTDEGVLGYGIGHLEGSSLPIGGPSTHSVLVGHRGLSTASLFTRLDEMEIGDNFIVTVLGDKLYYKVDQIVVVEPEDASTLQIEKGQDYCTLLTCTPFGINTHRLLVRGKRIEAPTPEEIAEQASGFSIPRLYVAAAAVFSVLFIIMIVLTVIDVRKRAKKKKRVVEREHVASDSKKIWRKGM